MSKDPKRQEMSGSPLLQKVVDDARRRHREREQRGEKIPTVEDVAKVFATVAKAMKPKNQPRAKP